MAVSKYVKEVIGVEIVQEAVKNAKENCRINQIENCRYICQDATEFARKCAQKEEQIDVVFVDPPRKGCSTLFLNQLLTLSPDKIVYISCDVATQARDIDILQQHGYHAVKCQPVDMFPQSFHIENIVLLTK